MRPKVCCGSSGCCEIRIQSTSIGAPSSFDLQARALAHGRMPPIGADDQLGANLQAPLGVCALHAGDAPVLLDQIGHLGLHAQLKPGISAACSARKLRKSHCGINAMNLQCVGRCVKSATVTTLSADLPLMRAARCAAA